MTQQARDLLMDLDDRSHRPGFLMHDVTRSSGEGSVPPTRSGGRRSSGSVWTLLIEVTDVNAEDVLELAAEGAARSQAAIASSPPQVDEGAVMLR